MLVMGGKKIHIVAENFMKIAFIFIKSSAGRNDEWIQLYQFVFQLLKENYLLWLCLFGMQYQALVINFVCSYNVSCRSC